MYLPLTGGGWGDNRPRDCVLFPVYIGAFASCGRTQTSLLKDNLFYPLLGLFFLIAARYNL